jgi:RNA polymerase sigma factor (sigma-70 family)
MTDRPASLLYRLRRSLREHAGAVPDAELLARYARGGDQAAFELLLWRHGPMVWGVCRRLLAHAQDAEDAFQAAFLALARKAGSVGGTSLGGWLYRVASRAALAARQARRRAARAAHTSCPPRPEDAEDPAGAAAGRELARLLDDEIARLPERFRLPFILCELGGRSRAEAAAELNCPVGTVESRLHRARARLRTRLKRRGLGLPAGLAAAWVPEALRAAALRQAAAPALTPAAPASLLAEQALRSLAAGPLLKSAGAALAACLLLAGAGLAALRPQAAQPQDPPPVPPAARGPAAARRAAGDADKVPLPTEALARVGSARLRHGSGVCSLTFSPDGKWIASTADDGGARVWDAATGRLRLRVPVREAGRPCLAFFTQGGQGVAVIDAGSYRVLDLATARERLARPFGKDDRPTGAAAAPDGRAFVTGREGRPLQLYDAASGEELRELPATTGWEPAPAFSPAGGMLAVVSGRPGAGKRPGDVLKVLDTATAEVKREITDGERPLAAPVFGPGGKVLASLSRAADGLDEIVLWDPATGRLIRRITGLEPTTSCAAFSPDGKLLAASNLQRTALQLFEVATGKEVRRIRCWPSVLQVAFSPDGRTVAAGTSEGTVGLWDVASGRPHPATAQPGGGVSQLRFTDGGRSLLVVAADITALDWRTGREVRRYADPRRDNVCGLSLGDGGRLLAACDWDATVRVVDGRTGKELHALKGHAAPAIKSLLSPDGRRLFTRSYDKTVRTWDLMTGKELHRQEVGVAGSLDQLALSPDGKVLVTSARESRDSEMFTVRLWDADRFRDRGAVAVVKGPVWGLAFSPDGTLLAGAGEWGGTKGPSALVWDVATGRELRSFTGHQGRVYGVAFSPDGRVLATGGQDRTVRLWEVASGKERHRFAGHEGAVGSLAFSPDGRLLASSSSDAPVLVWDVAGTGDRPPSPAGFTAAERDHLWEGLADADAAAAFGVMRRLLARPGAAVELAHERLQPIPPADGRVRRLLRDLNDERFAVRESATAALKKVAGQFDGALRQAREQTRSAETRRRLDEILQQAEDRTPERLRQVRAVEVLELIGSPEAVRVLDGLAAGAAGARLTNEAAASRERVRRRHGP